MDEYIHTDEHIYKSYNMNKNIVYASYAYTLSYLFPHM